MGPEVIHQRNQVLAAPLSGEVVLLSEAPAPLPADLIFDAQGHYQLRMSPPAAAAAKQVAERIAWAVAPRTAHRYHRLWLAFASLADRLGRPVTDCQLLTRWLWTHAEHRRQALSGQPATTSSEGRLPGWGPRSLAVAVAAVSAAWEVLGHPPPSAVPGWQRWFEGCLRQVAAPPREAPAFLREHLRHAVRACVLDADRLRGLRDRALLVLGWHGALRRDELVSLQCGDVHLHGGERDRLELRLRSSKTDQAHRGQPVVLASDANSSLDPATALRDWREASGITDGPLFRRILTSGRLGTGQLSAVAFVQILRQRSGHAHFTGHSLRAGWETQAAQDGVPLPEVMHHARQRSLGTALRYLRLPYRS